MTEHPSDIRISVSLLINSIAVWFLGHFYFEGLV
jgi:hypothetical protein